MMGSSMADFWLFISNKLIKEFRKQADCSYRNTKEGDV
jgi:hypothetical protein